MSATHLRLVPALPALRTQRAREYSPVRVPGHTLASVVAGQLRSQERRWTCECGKTEVTYSTTYARHAHRQHKMEILAANRQLSVVTDVTP